MNNIATAFIFCQSIQKSNFLPTKLSFSIKKLDGSTLAIFFFKLLCILRILSLLHLICIPLNPSGHSQMYPLTSSTQVALFWHGLDMHSLTLTSHVLPSVKKARPWSYDRKEEQGRGAKTSAAFFNSVVQRNVACYCCNSQEEKVEIVLSTLCHFACLWQ